MMVYLPGGAEAAFFHQLIYRHRFFQKGKKKMEFVTAADTGQHLFCFPILNQRQKASGRDGFTHPIRAAVPPETNIPR